MSEKNESKDLVIERILNAPRELVWKCYTEKEHMINWWGPTGFTMLKAELDLRPGGMFHYGMRSPEGHVMWGKLIFREIIAPERLVMVVSFSDENGGTTRHPLAANWPLETLSDSVFEDLGDKTKIILKWRAINASKEECDLFDASHAGMQMGHDGTFKQLEAYLEKIK